MAQGNVSYQKTDFGAETPDLFQYYVRKLAQIAGIPIRDGIDKDTLKEALDIVGVEATITLLQKMLATETYERQLADTAFSGRADGLGAAIANEIRNRNDSVATEANARATEDAVLRKLITALQEIAHEHENKEVLDEITRTRMAFWDIGGKSGAEEHNRFVEFVRNVFYGNVNQFRDLYTLLGIEFYDGGYYGMTEFAQTLDGGSYGAETELTLDSGAYGTQCVIPEVKEIEFASEEEIIDAWNEEDE